MENKILSVKNINKYFGSRHIIKDLSFDMQSGEILGFLGPNGSGKTTTIKMIIGLLNYDSGEIKIDGHDRIKDFEKALSTVGGIIENPDTYSYMSGYKNLVVYGRMRGCYDRKAIDDAVELCGLTNRITNKVKTYSLGMKQRLGLAQAILHKPKLLILDEPTNGLDPAGIKELRFILKKLAHEQGVSVMVSSHILSEMQLLCDRVIIIDSGAIIGEENISPTLNEADIETSYIYEFVVKYNGEADILFKNNFANSYKGVDDGVYKFEFTEKDVPAAVKTMVSFNVDIFEIKKCVKTLEDSFMEITGGGNTIA